MFSRKYIIGLFLLLSTTAFISSENHYAAPKVKWVILKECQVTVNGSTNVNKFSCSIPDYTGFDTLNIFKNSSKNLPVGMSGRLKLPVSRFDCLNKMMTKDLRKTLNSEEFPMLYIKFISLEKYPDMRSGPETLKGAVSIELAGVSKKVNVNYKISMDDEHVIHLLGKQSVNFSDFQLTPPKKFAGMVRANDKLEVEFNINFKVIED